MCGTLAQRFRTAAAADVEEWLGDGVLGAAVAAVGGADEASEASMLDVIGWRKGASGRRAARTW